MRGDGGASGSRVVLFLVPSLPPSLAAFANPFAGLLYKTTARSIQTQRQCWGSSAGASVEEQRGRRRRRRQPRHPCPPPPRKMVPAPRSASPPLRPL